MYVSVIKPFVDRFVALTILIMISPLLLALAATLFVAYQGNPFFVQRRPGWMGRPFYVIKFRTMKDDRNENGVLLTDEQRLTRLGKMIRSTSLDEMPQLINVVLGHMSLIGPRPLLMEYLPLYTLEQKRRHEVKPGITGWAQVNGRNVISWSEKFKFDVWYVDNISLVLDLKILRMTVCSVLAAKDINKPGMATTELFNGSN